MGLHPPPTLRHPRAGNQRRRALGWTEENSRHMSTQNYANHAKYVPMFHFVLFGVLLLTFIGSLVNLYLSIGDHSRLYSAALIVVLTACMHLFFYYVRIFPLKAQDRAIRAEENLRYFVLTGKLLDPRLSMLQIVAL